MHSDDEKETLKTELEELRQCCGNFLFELVPTLDRLAFVCHAREEYSEAADYYQEVIKIRSGMTSPNAEDRKQLIASHHRLGLLFRVTLLYAKAEPHYQTAYRLAAQEFGEDHLYTAERRNYLAALYFAWGNYSQARQLLEKSLTDYRRLLGENNEAVAFTNYGLAIVSRRQELETEKDEGAQNFFKRSLAVMPIDISRLELHDMKELNLALMHLSRDRYKHGNYDEAEELFRQSLLRELNEFWPQHPLVANGYQLLGDLYKSFGMVPQAEILYSNALQVRKQVLGASHLQVAASAHSLGQLYSDNRRYKEAEPYLLEACQIRSTSGFPPVYASSLKALSHVVMSLSRTSEARELSRQADKILEMYGANN